MFLRFINFLTPSRNSDSNSQSGRSSPRDNSSSLAAVESALKNYNEGSSEYKVLSMLKNLQAQVEGTLAVGSKSIGNAIFKMFDYIDDKLPKKEVDQLRFYNKRGFSVYDKYLILREVNRELNEQMS